MMALFAVCLFFCLSGCKKEIPEIKQKVCLNMIVKNESAVIKRCLESVKPYISYWVIVDTGSTDGTQDLIREAMKDVPGELHERPWVNFAVNRNEALELAKPHGDYLMFIDADEYLVPDPGFHFPKLTSPAYVLKGVHEGITFSRIQLVKSRPDLYWKGVIHEYLVVPETSQYGLLAGLSNYSTLEGARSKDPAKFLRDAMVLEGELKKNPSDSRAMFYLAHSYRCHGNRHEALKCFKKRTEMGGNKLEIYESLLQQGILEMQLGLPEEIFLPTFFKAYRSHPSRAEPLYYISGQYRKKGQYELAYVFSRLGLSIPQPIELGTIDQWVYDYGLLFEFSIASYWVGEYHQSLKACEDLLAKENLPQLFRGYTLANKTYAEEKIKSMEQENESSKQIQALGRVP